MEFETQVWHNVHTVNGTSERVPKAHFTHVAEYRGDGRLVSTVSGEFAQLAVQSLAPGPEEIRGTLVRMRERLGWSRALMAAFLGVETTTLRRWEDGSRNPCAAARRLVWVLHSLLFEPSNLDDTARVLTWGKLGGEVTP